MPITFACPGCAKPFKVPDEMAGRSTRCTQCGSPLIVPGGSAAFTARQPAPQSMAQAPAPYGAAANPVRVGRRFGLSRKMLVIGGGGLFGVVLLGAVVWGGYKLFFGPSGLGEEAKYLPDNCQMVVSLRPEQVMNSDAYKEIKKEILGGKGDPEKDLEQFAGISPSNMRQVVAGFSAGADNSYDGTVVVKTVNAVNPDDLKSKKLGMAPQESKVANVTVYEILGVAWCQPDGKIVVLGKSETLKKVLERGKAPELSEGLRAALKYADFSKALTMAMDSKTMYASVKNANKKNSADFDKKMDQLGMANPAEDIDGAAMQVDVGKDVKLQTVVLCKDGKTATDMKTIYDGFAVFFRRLFPKYGGASFETWESSVSGARLHASVTIKTESVVQLIQLSKELGKSANSTFNQVGQQLGEQNQTPPQNKQE